MWAFPSHFLLKMFLNTGSSLGWTSSTQQHANIALGSVVAMSVVSLFVYRE